MRQDLYKDLNQHQLCDVQHGGTSIEKQGQDLDLEKH